MATDPKGNQNVDNLPQGCESFGGQDWEFRGCSEVLGFGSTNLGTDGLEVTGHFVSRLL